MKAAHVFPSRGQAADVLVLATTACLALALGCQRRPPADPAPPAPPQPVDGMVYLPGGTFRMGNDLSSYPDQRPAHDVTLRPFWMDVHTVTNRRFARFVEATGYVTTAERQGWSRVFDRPSGQWVRLEEADWRHPVGPAGPLAGDEDDKPVVHVSWHDAAAYASWAGKRLPTEAQWEYAARAGLRDADYPWGRSELVEQRYQANYWQGWFPREDLAADGYSGVAPVGSFPPNRFGLYDMSGNVWQWCADWYGEEAYRLGPAVDPSGPGEGTFRVLRGGSWLSAENNGGAYRVWVRSKRPPDVCYQDVGFRCVR